MFDKLKLGSILCLSLILFACSDPQAQADAAAESVLEPAETATSRVVALSSLTADLTQQLAPSKLVGIPGSDIFQEDERFADLSKVSVGRTPPNLEKIVALEPDLVLGAVGFHDEVAKRLEEIGITTLLVDVNSWESLTQITEDLATRLSADASPLLERYQSCLEQAPPEGGSILVLVSRQPILAPNQKSWAGDFLQQFNAENLAAELQGESPIGGYVTLSAEKVLQEDPETILIVDPANSGMLEQFQQDAFWGQLTASGYGRVYPVDYYGFVNPGSLEKIEEACNSLSDILAY
ncbi:MAG: ABC transporter substrate-binding protein [Cyanobacteriota bacterium]|nr:ABC transporter substrate-binding protein [Cyanobacteriota bacterium]